MISAEALLKPIAADKPCGDDISYDPAFLELDTLLQGKPETQFSAAEPPDWRKIRSRCQDLWQRSKHLRIATTMLAAELQADGFGAFREGLALLNGLVRNLWADVYPRLDPADGNDPTERVNLIAGIAVPMGTFGDPLKIIQCLREVPLAKSPRAGQYSMADILRSQSGKPGPDDKPAPTAAQIREAFKDTPKDATDGLAQALAAASDLVGNLDEALTAAVGAGSAASLAVLKKEIDAILQQVNAFGGSPDGEAPEATGAAGAVGQEAGAVAITGTIQSRRQAVDMLEKVRQYYLKQEPSSPVPYVLQHAQRLADMDFMQIIDDLAQDSTAQVQKIVGVKPEAPKEGG